MSAENKNNLSPVNMADGHKRKYTLDMVDDQEVQHHDVLSDKAPSVESSERNEISPPPKRARKAQQSTFMLAFDIQLKNIWKDICDTSFKYCTYCQVEGHWKRNCPKFLNAKNIGECMVSSRETHVLELNYVDNLTNAWIIDSGATDHVCSSLQVLTKTRMLNPGELSLRLGIGSRVDTEAV